MLFVPIVNDKDYKHQGALTKLKLQYLFLPPEPCAPMNLSIHYNASTAHVMWGAAGGARSYSVQAVTDQGSTVTRNTTDTNCFLNSLQCSQIYNITVIAQNLACDSVISETHRLVTG